MLFVDRAADGGLGGGQPWWDRRQENYPPVREESTQKPGLLSWIPSYKFPALS